MLPPWNKLEFLAAGGTSKDWANEDTPASRDAHVIDVSASHRLARQEASGHTCAACPAGRGPAAAAERAAGQPCCSAKPRHALTAPSPFPSLPFVSGS